eukprot:CAMPEP_0172928546 /NCGR_PEP_ID=MMETSP1075-20121228/218034_1 /TAXON_ID=2916 /ORGANISM="Ceratium fusus, Strain PA161109" /LENGTH=164 /DNA_ID=CAMNT_0013789835 /DNA_START=115 /DNA_END=609 /DNA_ORIENTATION=-
MEDLMALDPSPKKLAKSLDASDTDDILDIFDPLGSGKGAKPTPTSETQTKTLPGMPESIAAAYAAQGTSDVKPPSAEDHRELMMRAIQEDAQKMRAQKGASERDSQDPFARFPAQGAQTVKSFSNNCSIAAIMAERVLVNAGGGAHDARHPGRCTEDACPKRCV